MKQALAAAALTLLVSVGFFLWNKGARQVNEGTLAVLNNLKMPLGILASLVLLGERTAYVRLLIGLILMGGAALLCDRPGRLIPAGGDDRTPQHPSPGS